MKPRRRASALLTREDARIWLRINLPLRKRAPRPLVIVAYQESERRDANLMFALKAGFIPHWCRSRVLAYTGFRGVPRVL